MDFPQPLLAILTFGVFIVWWIRRNWIREIQFIRDYSLPQGVLDNLRRKRPELTHEDCRLVERALQQFFLTFRKSRCQFVSMPSQLVDELWHEFIFYRRPYEQFCERAFGHFLHHTPAAALAGKAKARSNEGLRRCWWFACREEGIDPKNPARLPLLFEIDGRFRIANGFEYHADCTPMRKASQDGKPVHCGGDFKSRAFDGSTLGLGPILGSEPETDSD